MTVEKGQTFTGSEQVDRYRSLYYAGASGDFNPIHIDPEFGKMVGLGGSILQGLCTLAFAAKVVTDWTGDPGRLKKIKCRFSAPVMMEDTISVEGAVTDVQAGRAKLAIRVVNQNGSEVLQKVEAEIDA
ncbi:MAG: MaoC family dehydratase [Syntrophobacterales bacterium]|nr:MaoC family dehydratase [Syntrophobacterales bacterium]